MCIFKKGELKQEEVNVNDKCPSCGEGRIIMRFDRLHNRFKLSCDSCYFIVRFLRGSLNEK